jgi:hypothetical protein
MPEKRIYKRFDVKGRVGLKTNDGMDYILSAYLDDVGLGGLRMYAQDKMQPDNDVRLRLSTPLLDRPLLAKGRIRNVNSIKRKGTDFYSMGVEFTKINKQRIKHLINKSQGWRKRPLLSRQHRRELFFLLKLLPMIILMVWPILRVVNAYSFYTIKEQQYQQRRREAEIYYLYHARPEGHANSSTLYGAIAETLE